MASSNTSDNTDNNISVLESLLSAREERLIKLYEETSGKEAVRLSAVGITSQTVDVVRPSVSEDISTTGDVALPGDSNPSPDVAVPRDSSASMEDNAATAAGDSSTITQHNATSDLQQLLQPSLDELKKRTDRSIKNILRRRVLRESVGQ
ncbi:hypothetical protein DAKH74_053090 [Maudiozyma humilis]|uniref:Uncharacterized protein n=1 Tax=Maudiozyma humilis TaxID=51915 RepID=A0AAV5S6A8_MAUHU|nr:hypothetical protein DAKH74_053090 [Kazachstania humilis]